MLVRAGSVLFVVVIALALSGCIGVRLKKAEITQLEEQLAAVERNTSSIQALPETSHAVVSADTVNQFLSQLDGYTIVLRRPRGATVTIRRARISFEDGEAEAVIEAKAATKHDLISLKLRVVSYVLVSAAGSAIHLRFIPLEVLPGVKVSIFRWHELVFVAALLTAKANDYASSMPDVVIPVKDVVPVKIDAPTETQLSLGSAQLDAQEVFPYRYLEYQLTLTNAVVLHDGIHLFISFTSNR